MVSAGSVSAGSVSGGSVSLDEDRVLVFELVRATEAAAVAAARFLGRGDRGAVDAAAVDAMRPVLGTIPMRGMVVIGKGEKEHDPISDCETTDLPGEHPVRTE